MDPAGRDAALLLAFQQSEWYRLIGHGADLPRHVYHYTTAEGFAGIIGDAMLRATNFSFLNDPSEVQYGKELTLHLLGAVAQTMSAPQSSLILQILSALMEKVVSESYVACFTELPDDLSQWRAYGTSAFERYSIGFDASHLASIFNTRPGGRFARILYQPDQQRQRITSVVQRSLEFVEHNAIAAENWPEVAKVTADVLASHLPDFKNQSYEHEAEWRIIRWHDGLAHDSLSFETSRRVLRPFLPVSLPSPLPISSVRVMAPHRKDAAVKAAEMLLRKTKCASRVSHSTIPFAE